VPPTHPAHRPRGHRGRRLAGRTVWSLLLATLMLVGVADPAAADPAEPSDFRSEVTAIEPDVAGIHARILGADSFLELTVEPGITVVVLGYQDEPYLRFLPDGTVEHNVLSPATYLNDDRRGDVALPARVDASAEPEWEAVASGGTYAWHDHRTHWMAEASPPVPRGERVSGAYDPWRVPLTVDGERVEITGTLTYAAPASPIPWFALAVVVAVGLVLLGRSAPLLVGSGALTLVSALAVVLGRDEYGVTPGDAGANPLLWVLPAIALVAAVAAVALGERSATVVMALASVAALTGWAMLRIATLLRPALPTTVPAPLDRAGVALALGAAVGAAWLAVSSGALALPSLDDPDEDLGREDVETTEDPAPHREA
jgi:hypothetical protein